jgi:hypothetical protein
MAERLPVTHFIFVLAAGLSPARPPTHANRETAMAATRKSAKRRAAKKRAAAKRPSSKKQPARKSTAKRRSKKATLKTTSLKRQAKKGLKAARGGLDSVLQAGKKTWEKLKDTTSDVIG